MTRRIALAALGLVLAPFLFLALYAAAGFVLAALPRNADRVPPDRGIAIMVQDNGFHTAIVMPIVTAQWDWRRVFPFLGGPVAQGRYPTHVAIGYGEAEVFLNTPTLSDLDPVAALRIAIAGGNGLIRAIPYDRPVPFADRRVLLLRPAEYERLSRHIAAALPPPPPGGAQRSFVTAFEADARYFTSRDRYTLARTCNVWTGDMLALAGVEMGLWTPFAGGVMRWIPRTAPAASTTWHRPRRSRPAHG